MNLLNQPRLNLIGGMVRGSAFLPASEIGRCATFRDAVRLCWTHRRIKAMTLRTLAERIECWPAHVTDYLHGDDKPARRNLPAHCVADFEAACGNRAITQWLMRQANLHIAEEMMERMRQVA